MTCARCGAQTEWDDETTDPLCVKCWDKHVEKTAPKGMSRWAIHRSNCAKCSQRYGEYQKEYRKKHRERLLAKHKLYYKEHREEQLAYRLWYRKENLEKVKAQERRSNAKYRAVHREQILTKQRIKSLQRNGWWQR